MKVSRSEGGVFYFAADTAEDSELISRMDKHGPDAVDVLAIERVPLSSGSTHAMGMLLEISGNTAMQARLAHQCTDTATELLQALQRLHACMQAQDLETEAERPTEDDYQACMAAAAEAIAKATAQPGGAA